MQNRISCLSHAVERQFAEAIDALGHASGAVSKLVNRFLGMMEQFFAPLTGSGLANCRHYVQ